MRVAMSLTHALQRGYNWLLMKFNTPYVRVRKKRSDNCNYGRNCK